MPRALPGRHPFNPSDGGALTPRPPAPRRCPLEPWPSPRVSCTVSVCDVVVIVAIVYKKGLGCTVHVARTIQEYCPDAPPAVVGRTRKEARQGRHQGCVPKSKATKRPFANVRGQLSPRAAQEENQPETDHKGGLRVFQTPSERGGVSLSSPLRRFKATQTPQGACTVPSQGCLSGERERTTVNNN